MLIVFTNSKGGVGKTTLAVHMAIWLHDLGYRVALLDVDKEHLSSRWVRLVEPNVTVRTANNPKQIQRELVTLESEHDFIIVDGPGGTEPVSVALLLKADLALLPIMAAPLDLWSVATTARAIRSQKRPGSSGVNIDPPAIRQSWAIAVRLLLRRRPLDAACDIPPVL